MPSMVHTVLVVDDEPALRHAMARVLADEGYNVLTADSGQEALVIADSFAEQLSLVVTDLDMPGMGGTELATHLMHLIPTPRVLFVSGGEVTARIASLGTFLAKPFLLRDFVHRVRGILGRPKPPTTEPSGSR